MRIFPHLTAMSFGPGFSGVLDMYVRGRYNYGEISRKTGLLRIFGGYRILLKFNVPSRDAW